MIFARTLLSMPPTLVETSLRKIERFEVTVVRFGTYFSA